MAKEPKGLTEKRRRFVEAFVGKAAGNATKAARIAGYSGNDPTLRAVASELLTFPNVKAEIDRLTKKLSQKAIMDAVERQSLLTAMARGEEMDIAIIDGVATEVPAALSDRRAALDLLNKMQGSYLERVELSGTVEHTIQVYIPGNGRDK